MHIIKQSKGSVSLFVLIGIMLLFLLYGFTADIARLYAVKVQARHALNLALRAANTQIDIDVLADPENPRIAILESSATSKFYEVLQQNLKLDSNLNPNTGSIADGRVEIEYFQVVNNPPQSYNWGSFSETLTKTGSTAIIKIPVKMSAIAQVAGMPAQTEVYVHSTVYTELTDK